MKLLLPIIVPAAAALAVALVLFWPADSIRAQTVTCQPEATAGLNSPGLVADCNTLLGIKSELEGSGTALNWSASLSISQWEGITLSGSPRRVVALDLPGKGLAGSVPAGLADLTALQSLGLRNNRLTGEIPDLSALTGLTELTFSQNRLTGPIPAWLGDLPSLCCLGLRNNRLEGPIPPELGQLTHLRVLKLRDNRLVGSIPPELGKLTRLRGLALNNNRLGGTIPAELGCLGRLERLQLGGSNRFTGTVPRSIQALDITNPTPRQLRQEIGLRWGDDSTLCRTAIRLRLVAAPTNTVSEGGSIVVNVRTNRVWAEGGTVTIAAVPSGKNRAVPGSDFTLSQTSFTVPANRFGIIGSFTVSTVDDSEDGPDRKQFKLTASHDGIIDAAPLRVFIEDNDVRPDVRLRLAAERIPENGGTTTVTAELSEEVGSDVTVTVDVKRCDCTLSGNTLTISAGDRRSSGTVTITAKHNDKHSAQDPRAEVTGTSSGHPTNPVRSAVLTIVDDDEPAAATGNSPNIRLRLDERAITENGGVATVRAQSNDWVSGSAIIVTVSVVPDDCECVLSGNPTLTIEPGSQYSTGTVTITAEDNNERSRAGDLAVEVTGTASTGAAVRGVILTIRDDD